MFEYLFSSGKIGNLNISNRMVVPAMVMNYCKENGMPTERYLSYYEAKAKGNWGLIITEDYAVDPRGKGYTNIPGLWKDEQIKPHSELPKRIHKYGSKIFSQIYHAGRQTNHLITGTSPVAPSPIPCPTKKEMPHELTICEIQELVEKFGDCAYRAKIAGFDGVEVHGGHGYLVAQFLSAYSNKRGDKYGGSLYNRTRFAREIISNIKSKAGNDFPMVFRISGDEFVPGGRTIEETKAIAMILEEAGVNAIHVSMGVYGSRHTIVPPARMPHAWSSSFAQEIKKTITIPVITVGWINDPFIAESLLRSGRADFVAMGRASIADSELPNKIANRKFDDIIYCIGCMQGCAEKIRKQGQPAGCLLNPLTGRENEYAVTFAKTKKKVLIAGAGVAGMEAAIVAAKRGHHVELFEKTDKLGGNFLNAAIAPGKGEFSSFIAWQKNKLEKLKVKIHLNKELTKTIVESVKPDVVIIATGSDPIIPDIPGKDNPNIISAIEVLSGSIEVGDKVVIIGGGMIGSETANHLSSHEKEVTIIEKLPEIAIDEETNTRKLLLQDLENNNVKIYTNVTLKEFLEDGVFFLANGKERKISPVDNIIIAVGAKPKKYLFEQIKNKVDKAYLIGDALEVRKALDAIEEGYKIALKI